MRAQAMTGRSRLLLAVLLAVLGVGAAVAPAAANGYPAPRASSVHAGTVKSAPSIQDELRDWLRLSGAARHAQATALPDTWSAVCPQDPDANVLRGRLSTRQAGAGGAACGTGTPRSSRAPPRT